MSVNNFYKYFNLLVLYFLLNTSLFAENISLEFKQINLPNAISILAKILNISVIISPSVHGYTSLRLKNVQARAAFDLLLSANGLVKWEKENVWFIGPLDELSKHKQDEIKWQIMFYDSSPLQTYFRQIKFANAKDILHLLQEDQAIILSKRGAAHADLRTNRIYIVDTKEHLEKIKRIINHFDVPVKQILIKARLASVDNDCERELGIHFNKEKDETNHLPIMTLKLVNDNVLDIKLSALEKAGHAEIISSPSLFTVNQLQASIEAGEEVPYQEMSEKGVATITFKKAMLGLKVTPQILPDNKVLLQLQINQDRPSNKMVLGMPMISTRQIMTSVLVQNGQTLVLGGIYEEMQENAQQQIPFIHRLPIVGLLFKQRMTKNMKRELLIFVTPKIIG